VSPRMVVTVIVIVFALIGGFVVCDLAFDDENEPGDLGAPAWTMDRDERNRNGDCRHTNGPCSDDDQLAVVICVEPGSCRFG
jgi:hypothetical protein